MSEITLEEIEAKQQDITDIIARFKTQKNTAFIFPKAEIELGHNEHYAGIILGQDCEKSHHLILCDGEAETLNWKDAKKWAKDKDHALPNRREQSLLFANLKDQFKDQWYWSSESHAGSSSAAWCQHFKGGHQNGSSKDYPLRCRAVRRVVIE